MSPFQLVGLLVQVALEALKLYRDHAVVKGAKLDAGERKAINAKVVEGIKAHAPTIAVLK